MSVIFSFAPNQLASGSKLGPNLGGNFKLQRDYRDQLKVQQCALNKLIELCVGAKPPNHQSDSSILFKTRTGTQVLTAETSLISKVQGIKNSNCEGLTLVLDPMSPLTCLLLFRM